MRENILPNDVVLHKPSGETWVVAAVNYDEGRLIPKGEFFPARAKIANCELIECGYENELQDTEIIKYLMNNGLSSYVDARSAIGRGWF